MTSSVFSNLFKVYLHFEADLYSRTQKSYRCKPISLWITSLHILKFFYILKMCFMITLVQGWGWGARSRRIFEYRGGWWVQKLFSGVRALWKPSVPDPRSCIGNLSALRPVHDLQQTTSWHNQSVGLLRRVFMDGPTRDFSVCLLFVENNRANILKVILNIHS